MTPEFTAILSVGVALGGMFLYLAFLISSWAPRVSPAFLSSMFRTFSGETRGAQESFVEPPQRRSMRNLG